MLAGEFLKGFAISSDGFFKPCGPRLPFSKVAKRDAEVALGRSPFPGRLLAGTFFQGFAEGSDGFFKPCGSRLPFSNAAERDAEVVLLLSSSGIKTLGVTRTPDAELPFAEDVQEFTSILKKEYGFAPSAI